MLRTILMNQIWKTLSPFLAYKYKPGFAEKQWKIAGNTPALLYGFWESVSFKGRQKKTEGNFYTLLLSLKLQDFKAIKK